MGRRSGGHNLVNRALRAMSWSGLARGVYIASSESSRFQAACHLFVAQVLRPGSLFCLSSPPWPGMELHPGGAVPHCTIFGGSGRGRKAAFSVALFMATVSFTIGRSFGIMGSGSVFSGWS